MRDADSDRKLKGSTASVLVKALESSGVSHIFTLPGVQNDHLFVALHDSSLRCVHTRHEQGAAYMALGAAMASGKPAPYAVVPGPGFLNTTAALATAYACSAPVMAITGQIPSHAIGKGYGLLHEIPDQTAIVRSLTRWSASISSPQAAWDKTHEAIARLSSKRFQPVGLECPADIWAAQGEVSPDLPEALEEAPIDLDAIVEAAQIIGNADSAMIVVGGGAQDASEQVRRLATDIEAPVIAHRMGHGVVDGRDYHSLNFDAGFHLWPSIDVVIAIGTRFQVQAMQWRTNRCKAIIRIEIDPNEMNRFGKPTVGLCGDAGRVLGLLLEHLPRFNKKRTSREDELRGLKAESAKRLAYLQPQIAYLESIRRELPEEGIFIDELTQLGYVSRLTFPVYEKRTFLSPGYQGTLGWAFPVALGARIGSGGRPVVAVSGDGGFLFNVQELATAVQHKIPVVVVLMNDFAYGNVRRSQVDDFGNRVLGSDLQNPDFRKLVESFGARYHSATTPEDLGLAVREALRSDWVSVVEVQCGPMPSPWPILRQQYPN
jgi:acetolactate synthase-1/2/3 large subunit